MRHLIRKIGIIFSIVVVCATAFAGYCDTKFRANENTKDIVGLETKVDKGFEKIERKMDDFNREQVKLKLKVESILTIVTFLKDRAG